MKVALIVGHKKDRSGAYNPDKPLREFDFNNDLVDTIISRYSGSTDLVKVMRNNYKDLPSEINSLNPDFAISFHSNAYNRSASGSEVLYYHTSNKGKKLAEILQRNFIAALGLPDRGIKPRGKEDRGGYLLGYTRAPCVIVEPFFIDNNIDLGIVLDNYDILATAFLSAIEEFSQYITG